MLAAGDRFVCEGPAGGGYGGPLERDPAQVPDDVLDGLFARDKHLVHDSANACSLVLFLARPRAGAAGVETCMEHPITH